MDSVCVCDDRKLHQCFCTVCTYVHSMHIVCTTHCVCVCEHMRASVRVYGEQVIYVQVRVVQPPAKSA